MKKSDLFNVNSICIFTDSSFKRYDTCPQNQAIGVTAPAYCVYYNDLIIDQGFEILHNSTSQQGELQALLLGIAASVKYKQFKHIRLFSDNQNAILGIRERIFQWIDEELSGKNVFGSDGRISNQSYIMSIVYTILYNNIYLELYHIKGHVKQYDSNSVRQAKELFMRSNPFVGDVNNDLILQLAKGNTLVDQYSTAMLQLYLKEVKSKLKSTSIVTVKYAPFDVATYSSLVNRGGQRRCQGAK